MLDFGLDELEVVPYQTDVFFAIKCKFNQSDWEIIKSKGYSALNSASEGNDKPRSIFSKIFGRIDPARVAFETYQPEASGEVLWLSSYFPDLKLETYEDLQAGRIYKDVIKYNSHLLLKQAEDVDGSFIENVNSVTLESLATLNVSFSILLSILSKRSITSEIRSKANDAVSVIIESSGIASDAIANSLHLRKFKSDLLFIPEEARLPDTDEIVADADRKIADLDRINDSHCKCIKSALENVADAVKAANTADKIAKAKEARAALLANLK